MKALLGLFVVVIATFITTGCATRTRVHLYTGAATEVQVREVKAIIATLGFDIREMSHSIPREITRPTIIYSPTHRRLAEVEAMRDALGELGYSLELVFVTIGNHFYTAQNIGLYLSAEEDEIK